MQNHVKAIQRHGIRTDKVRHRKPLRILTDPYESNRIQSDPHESAVKHIQYDTVKLRKFDDNDLVYGRRPWVKTGDAAGILGLTQDTFTYRRFQGEISDRIHMIKIRRDWRYDMEDLLRCAYPSADESKIAEFMLEFRKNGGSQK